MAAVIVVTAAFPGLMAVSGSASAVAAVTASGTVAPAAVSGGTWEYALKVSGLGALDTGGGDWVQSISCASAGNCVVGGNYAVSGNYMQPFVAAEVNGAWKNAMKVPGLAALSTWYGSGSSYSAQLNSVSCASAGNCVIGGHHTDTFGYQQAFVAAEVGGTWHGAIEVPGLLGLNADGSASVTSVSCGAAGDCAVGGYYLDGAHNRQAFVADEVGGTWHTAVEIPGTAALNAGGNASVTSVSCAAAGTCVAGGTYRDSGLSEQAFVADESGGTWHTAVEVPGTAALNAGGSASVTSVSCGAAGDCAASGTYGDSNGNGQAFVADESGGTWHTAIEVPGFAALNTGGGGAVPSSVSCAAAGDCVVGGTYRDSNDTWRAFVADEVSGSWHDAIEVPGLAALSASDAYVNSVSCAAAGDCAAGGKYLRVDSNGDYSWQVFVTSEVGGTWRKAIEVPGTAALNTYDEADISSVSCASPGNCVTGGHYTDSNGQHAFVASEVAGGTGRIRGYRYQCASDYRYRQAPGTPVVIHVCDTMLREKWTIGVGRTLISHGLCLTDPRWGRWRTRQVLEPCTGWSNQRWTHKANGEYVSAVHGLCLTDPRWSTTSGNQLILQSCRDWTNQRWSKP